MSPFRDWAREFRQGFTAPSRLSAAVAALTFILALLGTIWFFTAPVLSGHLGRFLARSEADAEARVTWRALQLQRHPPDQPQLLILGSSAMANAVASEAGLERELYQATGEPWSVSVLTTAAQSTLDQVTLINAALGPAPGPRRPVVIALEMSLMRERSDKPRLLALESSGRLGLRSDWTDQLVREFGGAPRRRSGSFLIDNFRFVLARGDKALMRLMLGWPAKARVAVYGPPSPAPPSQRHRREILARLQSGHEGDPLAFAVLDELLARLNDYPRVHVVFVQSRLSPDLVAAAGLGARQAQAEALAQRYITAHGGEFWPVIADAGVSGAAYYDDLHIGTEADRSRVRRAVARRLAAYAIREGIR